MPIRNFVFIAALAFTAVLGGPALADSGFMAGAGRATVDISNILPLEEFTSLHDPLEARVVLFSNGAIRTAIAEVDVPAIDANAVAKVQKAVSQAAHVDPANIWVVAGHSFSTPHMWATPPGNPTPDALARQRRYNAAVLAAVAAAADQAAHEMQPARIGFGTGPSYVNVNRNVPTPAGWALGANDAGPSDKSLAVINIETLNHQPIAVLINYAVQSAVFEPARRPGVSGKVATTDLSGATERDVEQLLGGKTVALFLTGADGDQVPTYTARRILYDAHGASHIVDVGSQGFLLLDVQGERLAADALRISQSADSPETPSSLEISSGSAQLSTVSRPKNLWAIRPTKTYDFKITGHAPAPYYIMKIGDVVIVGVQVEFSAVTGMDIKRRSPFPKTIVITMVNGAAKYLPDAQNFKDITYEAINSNYGPGSAELLEAKILQDLHALHDQAK